jgi:hypothetical protein
LGRIINVPFTVDVNRLYVLGLNEAIAQGGQLSGDTKKGTFSIPALGGTFEGNYNVNNNVIAIEISKKPFLIPYSVIEAFLRLHVT